MKKLLTKAVLAGVLMAVFSVYGDMSNLVFYSDFEAADDLQPLVTSTDMNGATVAPPSLYDQTPPLGWVVGTFGKNTTSQFRSGGASLIVAFISLKTGGGANANLSTPSRFAGTESIRFSYDFKCNGGSKGVGQNITGYDDNNQAVFTIKMGGQLSSPLLQVTVNGVPVGTGIRTSSSASPLNSISLTLNSDGISVTFTPAGGVATSPISIPALGGANLARFVLSLEGSATCNFDYDNFQVWATSKVPPPPRLDLYMLTP